MFGFQCDCSVEPDDYFEFWHDEWRIASSQPAIWCCECGRWIRPGERYWHGSGIDPENIEDYDFYEEHDYEELTERDALNRDEFDTCLGCHRIAERFCPGGYVLGGLSENVSECLGFNYTDDPSEWDAQEVDEEDRAARQRLHSTAHTSN